MLARAGIEIQLEPGWKTYWRYPGDSGVPPSSISPARENVKSVTPLWPAPETLLRRRRRIFDRLSSATSFAVASCRRTPANRPCCTSNWATRYAAVCAFPRRRAHLALSGKAGADEPELVAAEARVPQQHALGEHRRFTIRRVHRETGGGHASVVVVESPRRRRPVDLFAEGPRRDGRCRCPNRIARPANGGVAPFYFDLDGLPPGAQAEGATLTSTAVSPTDAIECERVSTNSVGSANLRQSPDQTLDHEKDRDHADQGWRSSAARHQIPRHGTGRPGRENRPKRSSRARRSCCSPFPAPSRPPATTITCRAF